MDPNCLGPADQKLQRLKLSKLVCWLLGMRHCRSTGTIPILKGGLSCAIKMKSARLISLMPECLSTAPLHWLVEIHWYWFWPTIDGCNKNSDLFGALRYHSCLLTQLCQLRRLPTIQKFGYPSLFPFSARYNQWLASWLLTLCFLRVVVFHQEWLEKADK